MIRSQRFQTNLRNFFLLMLTFLVGTTGLAEEPNKSKGREIFLKTWHLVESNFFDPDLNGVDVESIKQAYLDQIESDPTTVLRVTNESLARLSASHTRLFHESEPLYYELLDIFAYGQAEREIRARFQGQLPNYVGILARTDQRLVKGVVPGGPAARAGVLVGDKILSADGKAFHPLESFAHKSGQSVTLDLERDGKSLKLSVVPERIQPREAFLKSISDSAMVLEEPPYRIGYVRMWSYAGEVYQERLAELLRGKLKDTDALLFDLRGSWGGASPDFAQLFLSQTELLMKPRGREPFVLKEPGYSAPVMILCDESVSSGKEILAYNLQKSGRAKVTGSPSRGAVLGGELHLLPHGYALYLARADVEVDGKSMEGIGVSPDHYLPEEYHFTDGEDDLIRNGKAYLLIDLIERDLKYRFFVDQQARTKEHVRYVDRQNQAWLKTLLENHGWPDRELYQEAATTAWLIAQHADNDLEFQKYALKLLTEAVDKGKALPKHRAYLQDRVLVNQGLPQIYGTQIMRENGVIKPRTEIQDREGVEERRKAVGLPPLQEYFDSFE